jgi:hypothetical protein
VNPDSLYPIYCKETGHIKRDCPKLANKNKSNQNKDMQKQLDEIQSRLHALCAVMSPGFAPAL